MKARPHTREKYVYGDGAIVEIKIWIVPRTERTPDGYKYSLVYINKDGDRVLGYDNAEGKGHHKHLDKKEVPFDFTSIEYLTNIFLDEVAEIRRKLK